MKESSCASVTNKFHSGKLCSAPPTKFFPYAVVHMRPTKVIPKAGDLSSAIQSHVLDVTPLTLGAYTTGQLEDSGRQNDEKKSRKIRNAQSRVTFFRHPSVLSLPAVLLRKLPAVSGRSTSKFSAVAKVI